MDNPTVAAIATPYGVGALSIVRVSGSKAYALAQKITKREHFTPRYAHLASLYSHNDIIDEAIVLYFKAPFSFTGEDVVEFQLHGGIGVSKIVLDTLLELGAAIAAPGEFSKRAFLNGKIDLTKAEAISKIIESKSVESVKVLASQLKGALQEFVETLRNDLLETLAYVEVNIDYAEEDLPSDIEQMIVQKVTSLRELLQRTLESSKAREGMLEGYKVAIVGKPNVGKSSLLNSLLNYDRAIISDIAGTTRDTIEEHVTLGSHVIKIIDTAGIRQSGETIEQIGIERSYASIQEADITIYMFDASSELSEDDDTILQLHQRYADDQSAIVVLNKCDLDIKPDLGIDNALKISTKEYQTLTQLKEKIIAILDQKSNSDEIMLTSTRQMEAIGKTVQALEASLLPLEEGELELFAYSINEAIEYISSITSAYDRNEILDKMFGEFCLGK
jgi:tRNA modification GTPase